MGVRRRSRRGFTLLEILIAIVVLVLGITGIVALFPTAIGSSRATVQDTYAAAIGQSVIDALRRPFYHPVVEEGIRTALRDVARQVSVQDKDELRMLADADPLDATAEMTRA